MLFSQIRIRSQTQYYRLNACIFIWYTYVESNAGFLSEVIVSINSIDHTEISDVSSKWDYKDETASNLASTKKQQAEARRRIEALKDIRESGLSIKEARELGLLH